VAILINKNTPREILDTISYPSGHYVFINCGIFSEKWSLLNLYAPNYDDELLMQDISLKVAVGQRNILIGGDFGGRCTLRLGIIYFTHACPHKSQLICSYCPPSYFIEYEYLSRTLSDHSPLTLSILFPDFCTFIRDQIKGVVHFLKKTFAGNLLTPMSSKMSMSFFLQSKRN